MTAIATSNQDQTDSSPSVGKKILIVGDGWAALSAVGFAQLAGHEVYWLAGSTTCMLAPLPTVERSLGGAGWKVLAESFIPEWDFEWQEGSYLREFRNKSFRPMTWARSRSPEDREALIADGMWKPEAAWMLREEVSLGVSLPEIQEMLRTKLMAAERVHYLAPKDLREILWHPVSGEGTVQASEFRGVALHPGVLGHKKAREIELDQMIFADRAGAFAALPAQAASAPSVKFPRLGKGVETFGLLQAVFSHAQVTEAQEGAEYTGILTTLHKESGDEGGRTLWGSLIDGGKRSVWTLFLDPEEGEDNHEIAKRLRRMKQAMAKIFVGQPWEAFAQMNEEQVRFEDHAVTAGGVPRTSAWITTQALNVSFLTDVYGPFLALQQAVQTVLPADAPWMSRIETVLRGGESLNKENVPLADETPLAPAASHVESDPTLENHP